MDLTLIRMPENQTVAEGGNLPYLNSCLELNYQPLLPLNCQVIHWLCPATHDMIPGKLNLLSIGIPAGWTRHPWIETLIVLTEDELCRTEEPFSLNCSAIEFAYRKCLRQKRGWKLKQQVRLPITSRPRYVWEFSLFWLLYSAIFSPNFYFNIFLLNRLHRPIDHLGQTGFQVCKIVWLFNINIRSKNKCFLHILIRTWGRINSNYYIFEPIIGPDFL